jgi:hypothetical protein
VTERTAVRKAISILLGLVLAVGGMSGFIYMFYHVVQPVKLVIWAIPITIFAAGIAILWDDFQIKAVESAAKNALHGKRPTSQQPHDWAVVCQFGEKNECLVDKNSIVRRGKFVQATVMYSADPPGRDKRNNKPFSAMVNVEEYDLESSAFRIHRIVLEYTDGTISDPLITDPSWIPADSGSRDTLEFLRGLH